MSHLTVRQRHWKTLRFTPSQKTTIVFHVTLQSLKQRTFCLAFFIFRSLYRWCAVRTEQRGHLDPRFYSANQDLLNLAGSYLKTNNRQP